MVWLLFFRDRVSASLVSIYFFYISFFYKFQFRSSKERGFLLLATMYAGRTRRAAGTSYMCASTTWVSPHPAPQTQTSSLFFYIKSCFFRLCKRVAPASRASRLRLRTFGEVEYKAYLPRHKTCGILPWTGHLPSCPDAVRLTCS